MKSHDFLHYYKLRSVPVKVEQECDAEATASNVEVVGKDEEGHPPGSSPSSGAQEEDMKPSSSALLASGCDEVKKNLDGHDASPYCKLKKRRSVLMPLAENQEGAGFFPVKWRELLCRCSECMVGINWAWFRDLARKN